MLKSSLLLLAVALAGTDQQPGRQSASGSPAPRVFVFTAEAKSTPPTEEEQGRLDSVRDVREALSRKAGLAMVSSAEEATVLVEVIERESATPQADLAGPASRHSAKRSSACT